MPGEPLLRAGAVVTLRGQPDRKGMVEEVVGRPEGFDYRVFFGANDVHVHAEADLVAGEARGARDAADRFRQGEIERRAEAFLHDLLAQRIAKPLSDNLYAVRASQTQFHGYQFKPLLKYLDSDTGRLLLADEVGLGKTIEAGIILLERRIRDGLGQLLVVCPAALRDKWRDELGRRFGIELTVLERAGFSELLDRLKQTPDHPFQAVVSLPLLRSKSWDERLEAVGDSVRFDMVIVDEAHHMRNRGTRNFRAGQWLEEHTADMLLLTATPLQLGEEDFFNLLNLLDPVEYFDAGVFKWSLRPLGMVNRLYRALGTPDAEAVVALLPHVEALLEHVELARDLPIRGLRELHDRLGSGEALSREERIRWQGEVVRLSPVAHVFSRTRRREVAIQFAERRPITVDVVLTPEQERFYLECSNTLARIYQRRFPEIPPQFLLTMPERIMASCLPAFGDYLLGWIDGRVAEMDEGDDASREVEDWERALLEADVDDLQALADQHEAVREGPDPKRARFIEAIRGLRDAGTTKVMVFSTFRLVLDYVEGALRSGDAGAVELFRLDGSVHWRQRAAVSRAFQEAGGFAVLVTSEVAGEGLDFQFCHALVNYDLPWNPMVVEQRIGRVDRFGQESPVVHIVNFRTLGTIEGRIFNRLYERIGIFEEAIGDLESILGSEFGDLQRDVLTRRLLPEEEERRVELVALAIERRRRLNEEFDARRDELMGQDEFFGEEITRIGEQGRYVGPEEVRRLVTAAVVRWPGIRIRPDSAQPGVWVLQATSERDRGPFIEDIRRVLRARGGGRLDRASAPVVGRLAGASATSLCFEPEVCRRCPEAELVTAAHPLTTALVALARERLPAGSCGALALPAHVAPEVASGDYRFFVFALEVTGFRRRQEWFPVVLDLDHRPSRELSARWWKLLAGAAADWPGEELPTARGFDEACREAAELAAQERDGRKAALALRVSELVERRTAALERYFGQRIARLEDDLAHARLYRKPEAPYVKMLDGKLRRTLDRRRDRLAEVTAAGNVNVGYSLVSCGVLRVGAHCGPE